MKTPINANQTDKKRVIEILTNSFENDPHLCWLVGEEPNKAKRMKQMMAYAFEYCMLNGEIHLNHDKSAVALWKKPNSSKMSFGLMIESIKFLIAFGLKRMKIIGKMEQDLSIKYPDKNDYIYLWFLGTLSSEQGKGYGSVLLNHQFEKATEERKSIILETSTDKNVNYYQKKGFEVYGDLELGNCGDLRIFLMRKEFEVGNISSDKFMVMKA
jgi:ribosomal protein S18 acetylase RimI-like enzyme